MIPLALKALATLKALPLKVQLALGGALAFVLLCIGLVSWGEHRATAKVEQQARADTTKAAVVVLDSAQAREARQLAEITQTTPATVSTGIVRAKARDVVTLVDSQTVKVDGKADTVGVAVVELIKADDAKIAADSAHAIATDSLVASIPVVEAAHAAVDTAMSRQITQGDSDVHESSHVPLVVAVLAVGEGARVLYNFLHHQPLFP